MAANGFPSLLRNIGSLLIQTVDGTVAVRPHVLKVTNATLTDNGDGSATLTTGSGGGGGAATSETVTVFNGTGSTLTKGTAVHDAGDADATSGAIKATVATKSEGGSANPILGLVQADIASGATGTVITFGSLTGLDTHTFAVGDVVMVDTTSPVIGLNLVPFISYSPSIYRHQVGVVTKSDATLGSIFVDPIEYSAEAHTHQDVGEGGALQFPVFIEVAAASVATPASGRQAFYTDSTTHHLTRKNSSGTVVDIEAGGGGSGTVTSVAMTVPSDLSVSGSPVTTSGTLAVTRNTQSANTVLAGPTTGAAAAPTYRALVVADLPTGEHTATDFNASGLTGATAASRYVGATTSGAPASGTFAVGDFIIDQTGKIYVCTTAGSPGTWTQIGASGSSGAMTLISTQTASGTSGTLSFTSIPGTYTHLQLVINGRCAGAVPAAPIALQFNSDTGANYDDQQVYGNSTNVPSSAQDLAQTSLSPGAIPGASAPTGLASTVNVLMPYYAATTFQKTLTGTFADKRSNSAPDLYAGAKAGFWRSTSAITRIDLTSGSGNWVSGSKASLYGIS